MTAEASIDAVTSAMATASPILPGRADIAQR